MNTNDIEFIKGLQRAHTNAMTQSSKAEGEARTMPGKSHDTIDQLIDADVLQIGAFNVGLMQDALRDVREVLERRYDDDFEDAAESLLSRWSGEG